MYELKVEDMTCGHCKARVTQALKNVDSEARVEIDLMRRLVRVESTCELAELTTTLAEAGYPATLMSSVN